MKNAKLAWKAFGMYAHAKHGMREINEHTSRLRDGADDLLDVHETVEHVVMGTMGPIELQETAFKAYGWAPRINKKLRKKFPWKFI